MNTSETYVIKDILLAKGQKKERARPHYACKQFLTASQAFNISMLSYQSFLCFFYLNYLIPA